MKVVECPRNFDWLMYDSEDFIANNVIFLAGGITGCPDWQKEMIQRFKDAENTVLLNPRRADFDINDPNATTQQIWWEHRHLKKADATLFWFPYHTLCPITLYELGVAAARGDQMFVGAHPAYPRFVDIQVQLGHIRPEVKVHNNFADLVSEVMGWIDERNE